MLSSPKSQYHELTLPCVLAVNWKALSAPVFSISAETMLLVIFMSSVAVQVPLVTVHVNVFSPCCKLLTVVVAFCWFAIVAVDVVVQ